MSKILQETYCNIFFNQICIRIKLLEKIACYNSAFNPIIMLACKLSCNVYFLQVEKEKSLFEQGIYHGSTVNLSLKLHGGILLSENLRKLDVVQTLIILYCFMSILLGTKRRKKRGKKESNIPDPVVKPNEQSSETDIKKERKSGVYLVSLYTCPQFRELYYCRRFDYATIIYTKQPSSSPSLAPPKGLELD